MKIFFIVPPNIHYIEPYAFVKVDKGNTVRPYLGLLYVVVYRSVDKAAKFIYGRASAISVISPGFKKKLVDKGVDADKIHIIFN